jgi:predicted nucleic acid-binding protein
LSGWLLDTNIVSELRRPRPNPQVRSFVAAQPAVTLHLSIITFTEIRFGIERLTDAVRRQDLTLWLDRTLRPLFSNRTLPVSESVMLRWRQMLEHGRTRGHTFAQPDLLIAATAALEDLIVVTRDTSAFTLAAVPVLDPWTGRYTRVDGHQLHLVDLDRSDLLTVIGDTPRRRASRPADRG